MITYLNEQINTIKPQAEASARAALDYGFANGLSLLDGLPLAGNVVGAASSRVEPPKGPPLVPKEASVAAWKPHAPLLSGK